MNPDELVKAAPAIAQGATALAAIVPFTAIVKKMLGPAADELAEMWKDQVRLYRYERQIKCIEKAERMAQEAGFTPKAVPIKLLFPLLEGASMEEDENLHDMWAALLANASAATGGTTVRPSFIAILRHMAPDEAGLLRAMAAVGGKHSRSELGLQESRRKTATERARLRAKSVRLNFPSLPGEGQKDTSRRLQICDRALRSVGLTTSTKNVRITVLGAAFLLACSAPKPVS